MSSISWNLGTLSLKNIQKAHSYTPSCLDSCQDKVLHILHALSALIFPLKFLNHYYPSISRHSFSNMTFEVMKPSYGEIKEQISAPKQGNQTQILFFKMFIFMFATNYTVLSQDLLGLKKSRRTYCQILQQKWFLSG